MTLPKDHLPDDAEARRRQQADPLVAAVIRTADDAGLTCPDAEVLGLYAERELVGEEQAAVSAHVGGCARCQATLQAIERAMPDAAGAADVDEAGGTARPARWFGGWRWLVPVTSLAAAAVVAVWLGQGRAPESTVSQATDTLSDASPRAIGAPAAEAELAREAPVNAPEASGVARLAPAEPPPSPASGGTAPDASVQRYRATARERVGQPTTLDEAERRQVVGGLTAAGSTAASAAGSTAASAAGSTAASAAGSTAASVAGSTAASAASPAAAAAAGSTAEPPSAAPQAADSAGARTATPAAAPPARAAALAEAAAEPANEQPASKETAARAANGASGRARAEEAPATPAWRVREGILERTRDEGRTWQRVSLPTTERIARVVEQPRGTVTVVTVAGTRLVSTDSGTTWRQP